jgi:hypothetical protein
VNTHTHKGKEGSMDEATRKKKTHELAIRIGMDVMSGKDWKTEDPKAVAMAQELGIPMDEVKP